MANKNTHSGDKSANQHGSSLTQKDCGSMRGAGGAKGSARPKNNAPTLTDDERAERRKKLALASFAAAYKSNNQAR